MNFVGSEALLDATQRAELDTHLQSNLYQTAESVARWVKERWGVRYGASGMTAVLHRLGYRYNKPKRVPGKPDTDRQAAFVKDYATLKENKGEPDVVLFMDATHPQHNPVLAGGWIKRGKRHYLKSNTGRRRLNINGAIDIERLSAEIRFDETIDATSTLDLFGPIERAYPPAEKIPILCDNARYYRSKAARAYLEDSRIERLFLPPYSPNLNLIERFGKFFKKKVLYNRYYETFAEYKTAGRQFFENLNDHAQPLRSLLTENFEIIRN